jgi:hypothetical protein
MKRIGQLRGVWLEQHGLGGSYLVDDGGGNLPRTPILAGQRVDDRLQELRICAGVIRRRGLFGVGREYGRGFLGHVAAPGS